jgi:hypothetical protein
MMDEAPFCWPPGQPLTVVQTDNPGHWSLDWKPDQILYFAGWHWDVRKARAEIWASDQWPPKNLGDLTNGWDVLDLSPALQSQAPPSPVEQKEG